MNDQHTENLFRRLKGQTITVKSISGGVYEGRVVEVTNDYVCLHETGDTEGSQVFLFYSALESLVNSGANS